MIRTKFLAAGAACLALAQPSMASAAQPCVAPADVSAGALYLMPIAYDAAKSTCSKTLKSDGFMARKGDEFIAPFRAKQAQSWPGAFRLMKVYLAQQPDLAKDSPVDIVSMLSSLPESSVRPFVDGMIGQLIAGEIKPGNCSKIERGMELLGPLPTENVAGLFAFIADIAELKNPSLCDPRKK